MKQITAKRRAKRRNVSRAPAYKATSIRKKTRDYSFLFDKNLFRGHEFLSPVAIDRLKVIMDFRDTMSVTLTAEKNGISVSLVWKLLDLFEEYGAKA